MNQEQLNFVISCVRENRVHDFYVWGPWREKREKILEDDHFECQECKRRGKFNRAEIVHHVKHLRDHPELALSDTYIGPDGKEHRQLISVCKDCHETVCHPERLRRREKKKFWTPERW